MMHHHAANPAAQPYLSLSIFSAPTAGPEGRSGGSEKPSYCGAFTSSLWLRFGRTFAAEKRESDFCPEGFIRLVSRLLHGHCFGA